jgi:hypothetical protein
VVGAIDIVVTVDKKKSHGEPLSREDGSVQERRTFTVRRSPFPVHRSPFAVRRSPFAVRRSPFAVCRLPFAVRRLPFAVRRAPFAVHRAPFAVRRAPFAVRRAPFTVRRTPIRRYADTPTRSPTVPNSDRLLRQDRIDTRAKGVRQRHRQSSRRCLCSTRVQPVSAQGPICPSPRRT